MSAAWKRLEKDTAETLGGTRILRGADFSQAAPDVRHALFAVETKYRKVLPRLLRLGLEQAARYDHTKPPLLVVKEKYQHGALIVMRLADFVDLLGPLTESVRQDENPSKRLL
jgi:hypothetical protein